MVAAVGSGLLVCLTASAAANGEKTPIDIADEYYGTHFGDVKGWVQGQYPAQAPPSAAPKPAPDKSDKKRLGRIYVTYTKLNTTTHRFYAGRTSMVVDLTQSLALQAIAAVLLRDKNHHMDENAEPESAAFADAEVDRFDVGNAIDYGQRYDDVAYWRIRGREQQLIDSLGGARSDTGDALSDRECRARCGERQSARPAVSRSLPRSCGASFTLTRDTSGCRASTSLGRS